MSESQEKLLCRPSSPSSTFYSDDSGESTRAGRRSENRNTLVLVLMGSLILSMMGNIAMALGWRNTQPERHAVTPTGSPELRYPARDAVEYEQVVFTASFANLTTPYQGRVTNENEDLWFDLYEPLMSRISYDEARFMPNKTAPITPEQGDGYVIVLNVFHDIHCLHSLRRAYFYFMQENWNSTHNPYTQYDSGEEALVAAHGHSMGVEHMDHCIDGLRQSLMCTGDITPNVFQYHAETNDMRTRATVVHECRSFEKLRGWLDERAIHDFQGWGDGEEVGLCSYDDPASCQTL